MEIAPACPASLALRILSRKWSYFVLRALSQPRGFSQIQRELRFVTARMLSRELKRLEEEGVITHEDAQYSRTSQGDALLRAIEPLTRWGEERLRCGRCPAARSCRTCESYAAAVGARGAPL